MYGFRLSAALLLTFWCAENLQAQDCGLWNVPGTMGQFFGHGFGAGHHAPMVRAPRQQPPYVARVAIDRSRSMGGMNCHSCSCNVSHAGCFAQDGYCAGNCTAQSMPFQYQATPVASPMTRVSQPIFGAPAIPQGEMPEALQKPLPRTQEESRDSKEEVLPTPAMPKPDATAGRIPQPTW